MGDQITFDIPLRNLKQDEKLRVSGKRIPKSSFCRQVVDKILVNSMNFRTYCFWASALRS